MHIKEKVGNDPWKLLVAVTLLNKTAGKLALPIFWDIIDKWPTPLALSNGACDTSYLGLFRQSNCCSTLFIHNGSQQGGIGESYPMSGHPEQTCREINHILKDIFARAPVDVRYAPEKGFFSAKDFTLFRAFKKLEFISSNSDFPYSWNRAVRPGFISNFFVLP